MGDEFTIEYNGIRFTRKVKGLIESAEYEFLFHYISFSLLDSITGTVTILITA